MENDKTNPILQAYKSVTENREVSDSYKNLVNRISRAGESYIRYGAGGMTPEEKRDLSVGSNAAGGYLVPIEMAKQIVIYEREFGVMRQLSTEFSTSIGDTVNVPRITAFGTSGWVGEGNAFTESDPTIGQVQFSAYKSTHIAQVSEELLQDTAFDVSSLLARIFGQNLGALQNNAFVSGNGTGRPTGIANNVTTGATLASNVAVTADELVNTYHSLLRPYRAQASWVIHDNTVAAIRKLVTGVSGDKTYLWQPGLQAGQPDTLLGRPVYTDPDVATMANSAKCILFGDFKAGYWIRNAGGITIQRMNELYAATGQVGFRIWQRVDGKQVDALAVKAAVNNAS
jgi:HK97 family phage major capsid protein